MSKNRRQNSFDVYCSRLRSIQTGRRPGKSAASRLYGLSSRWPVRVMNRSLIGHAPMTNAITCVGACVCVCALLRLSLFLVVYLNFLCSYLSRFSTIKFYLEYIAGDSASRATSVRVSNFFVPHLIGFCFSSFCLSQLSHYFVTCITPTYSWTA